MNDPNFPFGSIFQQVVREPAPQAMPEERVTESPPASCRSASAARW
jgi:hypothetical protein